jgi:hypothetical protein
MSNNSSNGTAFTMSETELVLTSIFICIVMLATIIGNSLVIFCVCYYPRLRGRTNYLIVSLAVADWLIGAFSLPFRLAQTVNGAWPFGLDQCKFWIWIDMLCSAASILSLTGISFDRLIAVVDPLKYEERMRPRYVYTMIIVTWLFALVCASLALVPWNTRDSGIIVEIQCALISKEYITFLSIAAFFLPLTVVLVNYGIIFRIAIGHARRLDRESRSLAANYCTESPTDANHNPNDPDARANDESGRGSIFKRSIFSFRRDHRKSSQRSATFSRVKQLKATKTLAVVIGVFCVCWLPFFVIYLTFQYCQDECFKPPRLSSTANRFIQTIFVNILPVVNSAANPIIYSCFNAEFRKAFKRILEKVMSRKDSFETMNTSFTAVPTTLHKEYETSST